MADLLPLNRDELRKFLPDQRSIIAFENLFRATTSTTTIINNEIGGVASNSNLANSISQESLRILKGANVLLWLSM